MVDPITGVGLASSILTLAETGYKISRRTIEFSTLLGELPPDLQECSNLVDVLVRTVKRLQVQLKAEDPIIGPVTALHLDLESLFNQCNQTADTLLSLLNRLHSSNTFSKAIKVTRKEGEIVRIRNKLDQHILALLFVLEEHRQVFNEDIKNTVGDLRADFFLFHQRLVEQVSGEFRQVEAAISSSKESLQHDVESLSAANGQAAHTSSQRLLAAQQDLSQNLNRIEQNFSSVIDNGGARLASRFQRQLIEHQAATRTLFQSVYNRQNDDLRAQIQQLYQEVTKALDKCKALQKSPDVEIPNNHLRLKASFEFDIRSHFIAVHISQGMEWVSSTVLFPTMVSSSWLALSVPLPRFNKRHMRSDALITAIRLTSVNCPMIQGNEHSHSIKINLSEIRYNHDFSKARDQVYSDISAAPPAPLANPYYAKSWGLGLGLALQITLLTFFHSWCSVEREDVTTKCSGLIIDLGFHGLSFLSAIVVWLVDQYSIVVDWKEVRSLFRQSHDRRKTVSKEELQ